MNAPDIAKSILASPKYRDIAPAVVERAVDDAIKKYGLKAAEKAARSELHALSGAYFSHGDLSRVSELLRSLPGSDETLERALSLHASTRERLPLANFDEILARVTNAAGRPDKVLDVGCGMDPVYLVCRGIACTGLDANRALMEALSAWSPLADMRACDVTDPGSLPGEKYPLALVMKLLPLLETQKKGQGRELLGSLRANALLLSFPTRSLGGRNRGMEAHYSDMIASLVPEKYREIDRFTMGSELFCLFKEN